MESVNFPQANQVCIAPPDLDESQCRRIVAYRGTIQSGSCDGAVILVTAWKPSIEELAQLVSGGSIYLSVLGGLPPHFLTTSFESAISVR